MPLFESHAGFNITEDKLQIVELNYSNKFLLENVDEEFFSENWNVNFSGQKFINILQNSFDQLILRKPLKTDLVSFSLPHQVFKIFEIPYDKTLVSNDLLEHYKWEISELFPDYSPDDFVIRAIEVDKSGFRESKSVIIIAAQKSLLQHIHKFCVKNKLKLRFADNVHLAANSFVVIDNPKSKNDFFISLYTDSKSISLIASASNYPFFFKKLNLKDQSEIFDAILNLYDSVNNNGVDSSKALTNYIAGSFVDDLLLQKVKDEFDISLVKFNPFANINLSDEIDKDFLQSIDYKSFTAAAGIALRMI